MNKKQKRMTIRIIVSAILVTSLFVLNRFLGPKDDCTTGIIREPFWFFFFMIPYIIIGYDILKKAFKGIVKGRPFDENFLMAVATIGAIAIALIKRNGDYVEAIAVMLFYQIGELFQSYAVGKSRKNISSLMDIRPDYANIEIDGKIEKVSPDEIEISQIITVFPGEKIPLDGIITEGESTLNTSALTGESLPRDVKIGDEIISGCINLPGVLKIQTTKDFGESTVSKILEPVESSSSNKSKSEAFISKFARIYTPVVVLSSVCLAVIPPLFSLILKIPPMWSEWIYRALTFLVISCPCALVISIPLSFFAGLGGASREGILIKGSNFLEALSKTKYVVFDKTGTLTKGEFIVNCIHHNTIDEEELIEYAALTESASSHPISMSLKNACKKEIDTTRVKNIKEISGHGVTALVDDKSIAAGNEKLMESLGLEYKSCHKNGTIVHMAIEGDYAGHIVISDEIKNESAKAIENLKKCGVKKTVMLTGDSAKVGEEVAKELNMDEVYGNLLPSDKVAKVEELLNKKGKKEILAFVGDGINDAPVLARADIGIAMGALGSDAAIEAADVVIMTDELSKVAEAKHIARKTIRIVKENIVFSIGVKAAILVLAALGLTGMWAAIFADVGVAFIAIMNAMRALKA